MNSCQFEYVGNQFGFFKFVLFCYFLFWYNFKLRGKGCKHITENFPYNFYLALSFSSPSLSLFSTLSLTHMYSNMCTFFSELFENKPSLYSKYFSVYFPKNEIFSLHNHRIIFKIWNVNVDIILWSNPQSNFKFCFFPVKYLIQHSAEHFCLWHCIYQLNFLDITL